jgi:flagellar assembly factor FliW
MRVATKALGEIDLDERQRISFPYGILGFEQLKEYVLFPRRGEGRAGGDRDCLR